MEITHWSGEPFAFDCGPPGDGDPPPLPNGKRLSHAFPGEVSSPLDFGGVMSKMPTLVDMLELTRLSLRPFPWTLQPCGLG